MENIKILENEQAKGIELYFETKPNQNTITELKNKHFRWHTAKKCWYNRLTQENKDFALSLANTGELLSGGGVLHNSKQEQPQENILKSLTPLTEEEKINFAKSEWQNQKMQDYILTTYNYYKTVDGLIFEIEKASKLSITKKIYYDDETEQPQVNFENFKLENEHHANKFDYLEEKAKSEYNKFYFIINGSLKNVCVEVLDGWELKERPHKEIIRELTADEKQDILTLYKQQKDEYTTRLQKYWNKYKDHITTYGYWANR